MKVTFDYLDEFARGAKALRKKYPSFESDYEKFLEELEKNPISGESLGLHTYKYRMAIASKGRGHSGGARVITLTYTVSERAGEIILLLIYDKADVSSVKVNVVKKIVKELGFNLEALERAGQLKPVIPDCSVQNPKPESES